MADLLKLKNNLESQEIDLISGTYVLRHGSWATGTPQPSSDYESVPFGAHPVFQNYLTQTETMDLIAQDTTHSTITAAEQDLKVVLDSARLFHQHPLWTVYSATSGTEPWFLHWNIDGETEKRCLLYEGSLAGINEQCAGPFISSDVSLLRMAFTRHPFWEPIRSASTSVSQASVSAMGGTKTISSVDGDVWARISSTSLYGAHSGTSIYRTWAGIREEMAGLTNFEPVWQLENAIKAGGAVNSSARWDHTGTAHVRVAAVQSSMTLHIEFSVNDMCAAAGHADYAHQIGEYLVLCRCAVDTGTVGLQMRYGYDLGSMVPYEEVFVSNADWRLIELGNIVIPPNGGETLNITSNYARYSEIQIFAEQVEGVSVLDLDCLVLIPRHHMWTAEGGGIVTDSTHANIVETTVNDKYGCYGTGGSSAPRFNLSYSLKDWYLPTGNSIIVVAGERYSQHASSDSMGLQMYYYPRWGMYR